MLYRRFGRTELQMPVLSTGGMRYQDGWKDKPLEEIEAGKQANLEATIRRSIELGINHIETARGYGVSERQLGVVLPTFPRDELIVQTKIGPQDDPKVFESQFMESLVRLRLDHVDLLAIHGINNDATYDQAVGTDGKGGCLAIARDLQRRGLCRHVGFSTHAPLDTLLKAVEYEDHGGFDYVNLHWYYIMQRNAPAIAAAAARDMGVFIISPSDKGGKLYEPSDRLVELCDPLHPIVFNDLWCLQNTDVHTLSVGSARPSDYDLHVQAVGLMNQADTLVPPIVARLEAAMQEATGHASPEAQVWELPDHREAPEGLNLPVMLWLRNLAMGWDMQTYGKMRFNMLGGADHWFPGAKAEVVQNLDPQRLFEAAQGTAIGDRLPVLLGDAVDRLGGESVKRLSESA